ncbi:hypothetical protein KFL_002300130 [Klebsormidium nitens]|uniref:MYND-type domain-containing protein n=1 Tax=Klebsormidium nitens TaxID=105231 RepID=A0A1Y1I872_KLENI|nr:hypothetical protein KFL_002300130 [Klebsormidium nitens]|eukprot:GAQ85341.1 hypothetical protein KFL_002300130 [Klebsormidium nitens]
MDEDLDKFVEQYAAMLKSGQDETIVEVHQALGEVYFSGEKGRETFSKIAQGLAAYQNGAFLKPLLSGALFMSESDDLDAKVSHYRACCLAVTILTSSEVVVKKFLMGTGRIEDKQTACLIYRNLTTNALIRAQALEKGQDSAAVLWVVLPLECLAKFIRGSRVFRDAMKDISEERNIFETLGYFLSAEFLTKAGQENAAAIRGWLSEMAASLAFSKDSQLWVLDMGLLKLMAAIYDSTQLQNLLDHMKQTDSPVFRCNAILIRLLEKEATLEKLRAHNALAGFRPHKRKINSADPQYRPWSYFEARLSGRPINMDQMRAEDPSWRPAYDVWELMHQPSRGNWAPAVCSWKLCTAGAEPEGDGKKYGKCAGCQVARYCSKEHQNLHWRTHKIHCQAGRAAIAGPEEEKQKELRDPTSKAR